MYYMPYIPDVPDHDLIPPDDDDSCPCVDCDMFRLIDISDEERVPNKWCINRYEEDEE